MSDIPDYVRNNLPSPNVSINEFLAISLPPYTSVTARLMRIKKYVSKQPPNIHNVDNVGELLPPPAEVIMGLKHQLQKGSVTSVLCPHLPASGGARYPLWIIEFWVKLRMIHNIQENWKRAANRLEAKFRTAPKNHLLQHVAKTLNHLPWTGNLLGYFNTIDLCELWVYFTEEWLTDSHLLVMLELLIEDIPSECHRCAFIENTHFTTLLAAAYNDQERYSTERSYGWIRDRGNQLANGSKTYLATIINQNNIHWVALLIDFDEKVIRYGDSTGHPIEQGLKTIFAWWTFYHTGVHFSCSSLVIGIQRDSYSCGMLAWDALRYQLAGPSPSVTRMDPLQPSDERLKMFLRLVKHYNTKEVSDFLYATCWH
jgi:hypothetical protein